MSRILGVKFKDYGPIYYFDAGPYVVGKGDRVIVETDQGRGMGVVAMVLDEPPPQRDEEDLKTIFRPAGEEDLETEEENRDFGERAKRYCRQRIGELGLEMKLVDVEVFHDRSKLIFYFTAPNRVDFRELVKDLVREFRSRIELRQIGVRHETQMIGAVGNCGQLCCCRRFMRKFDPVTIKMAKEQNLFLNPTKISGICGRLLCCLGFEQQNYEKFQKRCPRLGKRYRTAMGSVKVLRSNFFRDTLTLLTEDGEEREIPLDQWSEILDQEQPREQPRAGQQKSGPPKGGEKRGGRERPRQEKASGEPPGKAAEEAPAGEEPPAEAPQVDTPPGEDKQADHKEGRGQNKGRKPKGKSRSRRGRRRSSGKKSKPKGDGGKN
ncbi:PSP1 domain-containing protein, partial [Desulfohalovibrio reitneri]|uniref:PSP1 domain-containing protein n=1 Tax=Desulfohalovibrio reitneri TaxID=1307759 RepID=UPI0004A78003